MSKANSVMGLMGSSSTTREEEHPEFPGFYMSVNVSALQQGKHKLPQDFVKKFEGKVPKLCHLGTLSGTWHVNVKNIGGKFFLNKGWKEFVAGNCLNLGDHVVFYYTGHAELYADVYEHNGCKRRSRAMKDRLDSDEDEGSDVKEVISVDSDSVSDSEPPNSESSLETKTKCLGKSNCGKKKLRRGCCGRAGNLDCFSVRMCRTHLTKGPVLTPRSFMRNLFKPKKVELQVGILTWKVKWIHPSGRSSRFSQGWLPFVKQNGVKEGDVCNFELISKTFEVAVMRVFIRRM